VFAFVFVEEAVDVGCVFVDYDECFGGFFETMT